jgi:hypothetical protein
MKNFIIKIEIQSGESQKSCTTLVCGINKEEAKKSALLDECHGKIGENAEWTSSGISDLGDEFHYSIYSCVEVKEEHVDVLKLYLN